MKEHPDGPYVYSLWSAVPDDTTEFARWSKYLSLYRPMVEDDSVVYMELRECDEITSGIPDRVIASMFVNEEKYLVVSNLDDRDYTLTLCNEWCDRAEGTTAREFVIKPGKIRFLQKIHR